MLENNRDRGRIKWTAMMLPEHIQKLREWVAEDDLIKRPFLDDFDLQLLQEEIESAFKRECETLIKTWENGKIIIHQGIIKEIDLSTLCIIIEESFGPARIAVSDIVGVHCIN